MREFAVFLLFFIMIPHVDARDPSMESSIRKALSSGKPTMVVYGGEGCEACRLMKRDINKIKDESFGKANVICVDIWKEPSLGRYYFVQAIPTLIFYDAAGKEVKRHIGAVDAAVIRGTLLGLTKTGGTR